MRLYALGATVGQAADALLYGRGNTEHALAYATEHAARMPGALAVLKAAITPDGLSDWGAMPDGVAEFVELTTSASLLRIPGLVEAPPNAPLIDVTSNGSAKWVGEGRAKPANAPKFKALDKLPITKVAGIAAFSKELQRAMPGAANGVITRALVMANSQAIDQAFIDPANTGVTDAKPASIAAGAPVIASTGDVAADMATALGDITGPRSAVLVANTLDAATLAAQRDANGAPLYPDLGPAGGTLAGVPLYTSDDAPRGQLVLFNPQRVFVWQGGIRLDYSENAVIRLDTDPATDGIVTSLWQANLVGIIVEQFASWEASPNSVAVVMLP